MSSLEEIGTAIEEQGIAVRELKSAKADKASVDAAVAQLLKLKADYKEKNGGVDFGPTVAPKAAKKPVPQQVSTKEGPTKKELNKLARKEGHKGTSPALGGGATGMAPISAANTAVVVPAVKVGELALVSHASCPPELTQAVMQMVGTTVKVDTMAEANEPMLVGGGMGSISGDASIARYLVRAAGAKFAGMYDQSNAWTCTQVDQWLQLYDRAVGTKGDSIALLRLLEAHLADKTFVVGESFTLADAAMVLLARKKRGAVQHRVAIERWFALANAQMPAMAVPKKGAGKAAEKAASGKVEDNNEGAGGCPPLEDAVDGAVCTRFPPEPSGYLHIGHAKACLLNQYYAQRYKGKLLVRFDDTNPSKEKEEYEENIIKDLETLKIVPNQVSHTSDHFVKCQQLAVQMITDGLAYMDDTDQEVVKEERMARVDSKRRGQSVEENLRIFNGLCSGERDCRIWCMRAKIDMQSLNGTMRDPVLYRGNDTPHHRTGTKFKAYPTYDFACPIVDSVEGVTHALRTTEYNDRDEQYKWIQKALRLKFITKIMTFGKMNFVHTVLSKRKLNWFVEEKLVEGWFDPRFPTIQGCIRRGIDVEGLKRFIISQGASRRIITMEWDKFWANNKDSLEVTANRYMGVSTKETVLVTLTNVAAEITAHTVPLMPQMPEKGSRVMRKFNKVYVDQEDAACFKMGEEVTFLRWGNMTITEIVKNPDGSIVSVNATHDPAATNFSKTKKYTWLAAVPDVVECKVVEFDHLISKPKLDEGDDFKNFVNPVSKTETTAICDPCLRSVNAGAVIQLERKGFFRVDSAYGGPGIPPVLFAIPDGKQTAQQKASKK